MMSKGLYPRGLSFLTTRCKGKSTLSSNKEVMIFFLLVMYGFILLINSLKFLMFLYMYISHPFQKCAILLLISFHLWFFLLLSTHNVKWWRRSHYTQRKFWKVIFWWKNGMLDCVCWMHTNYSSHTCACLLLCPLKKLYQHMIENLIYLLVWG